MWPLQFTHEYRPHIRPISQIFWDSVFDVKGALRTLSSFVSLSCIFCLSLPLWYWIHMHKNSIYGIHLLVFVYFHIKTSAEVQTPFHVSLLVFFSHFACLPLPIIANVGHGIIWGNAYFCVVFWWSGSGFRDAIETIFPFAFTSHSSLECIMSLSINMFCWHTHTHTHTYTHTNS